MILNWTFLVPHAGNPPMLAASLASIKMLYPLSSIVVALRGEDPYLEAAKKVVRIHQASSIIVPGNGDDTDNVMRELITACSSRYAVYMEADCILVNRLENHMLQIESREFDFVGVEELIPWPEGRPGNAFDVGGEHYFRYAPGYHTASFWMVNIATLKAELPLENITIDRAVAGEPYYGLSAWLREKNKKVCQLQPQHLPEDYGFATLYGDAVVHSWFGAWRLRDNVESASGVPLQYLAVAEANIMSSFWTGRLHQVVEECIHR